MYIMYTYSPRRAWKWTTSSLHIYILDICATKRSKMHMYDCYRSFQNGGRIEAIGKTEEEETTRSSVTIAPSGSWAGGEREKEAGGCVCRSMYVYNRPIQIEATLAVVAMPSLARFVFKTANVR